MEVATSYNSPSLSLLPSCAFVTHNPSLPDLQSWITTKTATTSVSFTSIFALFCFLFWYSSLVSCPSIPLSYFPSCSSTWWCSRFSSPSRSWRRFPGLRWLWLLKEHFLPIMEWTWVNSGLGTWTDIVECCNPLTISSISQLKEPSILHELGNSLSSFFYFTF